MKFLVDANVLSEATKLLPAAEVVNWLLDHRREIAVNPIVLGELEYGIVILPASRRRRQLQQWFASAIKTLPVVDIDANTSRIWAMLLADLKRKGRAMPVKDSLIAASARQFGLTVATRNVSDYRYADVPIENPFEP